ncbi:hypothetical protein JNE25001_08220 [Escherichia coli]
MNFHPLELLDLPITTGASIKNGTIYLIVHSSIGRLLARYAGIIIIQAIHIAILIMEVKNISFTDIATNIRSKIITTKQKTEISAVISEGGLPKKKAPLYRRNPFTNKYKLFRISSNATNVGSGTPGKMYQL